jgi:DNA-binding NarL/FixJ family response regulator|tara:strand:+ start:3395 stop:3604 length:210 start_codon:yes stop_codon:yes gene_type:complete
MTTDARLTASEQRVASLLLEGLSNRAIAAKLVISHRTVECHISRALLKTGCNNRLELALWMLTMGSMPA